MGSGNGGLQSGRPGGDTHFTNSHAQAGPEFVSTRAIRVSHVPAEFPNLGREILVVCPHRFRHGRAVAAAASSVPAVEILGLTRRFGAVTALEDVSLCIGRGE